MSALINISQQQFSSIKLNKVSPSHFKKEQCAIIINEVDVEEFILYGKDVVGESVNQIIIISENLNVAKSFFEELHVLLISAKNLEEAVKISAMGQDYSKEVVYVSMQEDGAWERVMEKMKG